MSERKELREHGLLPNRAGEQALRIKKLEERARIAEQREAELVKLLEVAECPQCDGTGVVYPSPGHIHQCQWCDERDAILAKHELEQSDEG